MPGHKLPREFDDLSTDDALQIALEASHRSPVVVFKHSTLCGLSALAHKEMERLGASDPVRIFRVVVQRARRVSDSIEEQFGVRHESPQAIIVHRGRPVFNASHRRVTFDAISDALTRAHEPGDEV